MTSPATYVALAVQFTVGGVLLFVAMIAMALSDQANRGAPYADSASALLWLALFVAAAPALAAAGIAVARWRSSATFSRWVVFLPAVLAVIAAPAFIACLRAVYSIQSGARLAVERRYVDELRASVQSGSDARVCELVNRDPNATSEEQRRCLARIEARPPTEQWTDLQQFIRTYHFTSWTAAGTEPARAEDERLTPAVAPEHQRRFLILFFDALSTDRSFLSTRADRKHLEVLLDDVMRKQGWSSEARATMRDEVLPRLRERVSAAKPAVTVEEGEEITNEQLVAHIDALMR